MSDPPPEPDYRFSLANERTFLAWIRTSLALFAAGVGVIGVASRFSTHEGRAAIGAALLVLGALSATSAYRRWRGADAAIRAGRPLPRSTMVLVLGVGMTLVAVLAVGLAIAEIA